MTKAMGATMLLLTILSVSMIQRATAQSCFDGSSASVQLTQYWIPRQGTNDQDDNGNTISLSGDATQTMNDDNGNVIAVVDQTTYSKCQEEGTCYLSNGELVNLGSTQDTFQVIDTNNFPYGIGAFGNALVPFVSVAADDSLAQGTTLFVSELENFQLPNGATHNGCVRVDDRGVDFNCHIDWFVLSFDYESAVNPSLPESAHVQISSCNVQNYV